MTSQLGDCSDVGVDCDESVIKVQGLINTFEKLMADKSDVLLKIPPPLPVRHRVLPPVPPRNIVKYPDPLSESDDSFDSSDEDIPPPKGLPPILNWNNLPSLNLIEFPDPPSGDSFESSDDDETKDLSTVPTLDPFPTIPSDSEDSFNSFNPHYSTKLHNIIQEIIEKEESYVDCLETGMLNYMSALDTNELPLSLRGQKYRIFGNIQNLYEFHKTIFLPQLIKCSNDVEQLTELFTTFMQRDSFYGYVLYALNRRKSELLCNEHVYFFRVSNFEIKCN